VSNSHFRSRPNRSESPACRQAAGTLAANGSGMVDNKHKTRMLRASSLT